VLKFEFNIMYWQVVNETLRLYPPTDSISKTLKNTTVIGQYSFPAGADFSVSVCLCVSEYFMTVYCVIHGS